MVVEFLFFLEERRVENKEGGETWDKTLYELGYINWAG
jgi:hypothetical protein